MRHASLITFGIDDTVNTRLLALVRERGISLRVTRDPDACLNLMRQGAVGVLLLRIGTNLESEFTLLAQTAQQFPEMIPIVWGKSDHPRIAGLAWDLGARAVLVAQADPDQLAGTILAFLPGKAS